MGGRQVNSLFLEEWLKSNVGLSSSNATTTSLRSSSSVHDIIQAWTKLRECVKQSSFQPHHLQPLKLLVDSQASLHVADPQSKLILSILSSPNLLLPHESYHSLLRILYIWVMKSLRPSPALLHLAAEVLINLLFINLDSEKDPNLFSEGVLLLGAISFVPSAQENCKTACLESLCKLLEEEEDRLFLPFEHFLSHFLAGIGYALCSSVSAFFNRIFNLLLKIWSREDGPSYSITNGLMILHLIEWVMSTFSNLNQKEKLEGFANAFILAIAGSNYLQPTFLFIAAGVLRGLNRSSPSSLNMEVLSKLRISSENLLQSLACQILSNEISVKNTNKKLTASFLLQCMALALARASPVSSSVPLVLCLASALLQEIFPLQHFYSRILNVAAAAAPNCKAGIELWEVGSHVNSHIFQEAGAVTSVFCTQYASIDEDSKHIVESMLWRFCSELYLEHRKVAFLLRKREAPLLMEIEKVAGSAFLMVVMFANAMSKQKLSSTSSEKTRMQASVSILTSFSCLEYFRHAHLPEYTDTIKKVVLGVLENGAACLSFIHSIPSYSELINPEGFLQNVEYAWSNDEVQTARVSFYLRIIATCVKHLPPLEFGSLIAPTMFLYMGHSNEMVARASHSLFVAFTSLKKGYDENMKALMVEKLAFYYVQRSLVGYPGATPLEGITSGIVSLLCNLPAGSPAALYCIHSLIEKAQNLCSSARPDTWKNFQERSDPCKKILEFVLHLLFLVDIQVLAMFLKKLAELIMQLPRDGQIVILGDLYRRVSASDDVVRKPTLVSWLQSLSYVSYQTVMWQTASSKAKASSKIDSRL